MMCTKVQTLILYIEYHQYSYYHLKGSFLVQFTLSLLKSTSCNISIDFMFTIFRDVPKLSITLMFRNLCPGCGLMSYKLTGLSCFQSLI